MALGGPKGVYAHQFHANWCQIIFATSVDEVTYKPSIILGLRRISRNRVTNWLIRLELAKSLYFPGGERFSGWKICGGR